MLTVQAGITFLVGLASDAAVSSIAVFLYLMKSSVKQEATWPRDTWSANRILLSDRSREG